MFHNFKNWWLNQITRNCNWENIKDERIQELTQSDLKIPTLPSHGIEHTVQNSLL